MVAPIAGALGFLSSPIGRALGVGLIAMVALGYAYTKGAGDAEAKIDAAGLRGQIESLRADLRISQRAAEVAAAQEAQQSARAQALSERLQSYETGLADPPDGGGFTADDVRSLHELTR